MREPESHRLSYHPPEGGAHLEARNEDAGGDRERGGQDGEEEGGDDVDCVDKDVTLSGGWQITRGRKGKKLHL